MANTEADLIKWRRWLEIKAFFKRKEEQWQVSSLAMRFYVAGLIVLMLSTFAILVGFTDEFFQIAFTLGFVSITTGFLIEAYLFLMKILATTLGKVAATFFLALAIALANGMAQFVINSATGFDPAYFSGTRAFVTPLTAIYFVLFGSILLFFISICFVLVAAIYDMLRLSLVKRNSIEKRNLDSKLIGHGLRFFGALCLFGVAQSSWNYVQKPYEQNLNAAAARFTYMFEMFPDKACFVDKTIHIKRINEQLVMTGTRRNDAYVFQTLACPLDPTAKEPSNVTE